MGIDYLSCNKCEESFPDVIDYVYCDCGKTWCSKECAKKDGYRKDKHDNSSCKYCRKQDFEDDVLLKYALKLLGMKRKELINSYKIYLTSKKTGK